MSEVMTPLSSSEETAPVNEIRSYNAWVKQMIERLIEDEKKWIELASEQNSLTLKAIRQSIEFYRTFPMPPFMSWVREGSQKFWEAQQAPAATMEAEVTVADPETFTARQPFDSLMEFRSSWLNFFREQNTRFLEVMQQGFGLNRYYAATPPTEEAAAPVQKDDYAAVKTQ